MQTIDARGWECPKPLLETKKLMDATGAQEVTTIVDNQIAVDNMQGFAKSYGCNATVTEKDGVWHIHLVRTGAPAAAGSGSGNLVIVVTSDKFGTGSDELGQNLMKSYLYALTEAAVKPKSLIFMNSGVFLSTEGTPVLESLEALELAGVEIISCGACLNFYGLQDKVAIGTVGNMYDFVIRMNEAGNTIKI